MNFFFYNREQEVAHEQFNMADRSPTKKAQLKHAVSMKELNDSEVRGVHNTGFHEIYEECGNIPYDLEDGAFMVRNPQFTKRIDLEYMNEVGVVDTFSILMKLSLKTNQGGVSVAWTVQFPPF